MDVFKKVLYVFAITTIVLSGCESLKASKAILPVKEYERMIVGRLDANYIGTRNCLSACHFHDKIKQDFDASTMGAQLSKKSGMPLVDCESCHGPGSLAVEGLTPAKVEEDTKQGKQTSCDYKTLIDLKALPATAQSLICLKCHTSSVNFNLHNWNSGTHAISDVSCFECHNVHMGPDLTVRRGDMENMCERCHQEARAEFAMPSHHPMHEKKIFCTSCHEPHGTPNDYLLKKTTVKEVCTQCHTDKDGPFVYEHAENNEDCISCHSPHGSVNNNLLKVAVPFLCLQCHIPPASHAPTTASARGTFYTRCTDCHPSIHGTDIPSRSGHGRFTY